MPEPITPTKFRALTEKIIRPLPFGERLRVLSALASGQPVRPLLVENEVNLVFGRLLDRFTTSGVLDGQLRQVVQDLIEDNVRSEIQRRVSEEFVHEIAAAGRVLPEQRHDRIVRGAKLAFQDENELLGVGDLAQFLGLFRVIYASCLDLPFVLGEGDVQKQIASLNSLARRHAVKRLAALPLTAFPDLPLPPDAEITVVGIHKHSPLELWVGGGYVALTAAVIISGGEVDLLRGRFKLHSLGDGLNKLLSFWRSARNKRTPADSRKVSRELDRKRRSVI